MNSSMELINRRLKEIEEMESDKVAEYKVGLPLKIELDFKSKSPDHNRLLKYFEYNHLPENLQLISKPFSVIAYELYNSFSESNEEYQMCLRKLLEAKDCAVRAAL